MCLGIVVLIANAKYASFMGQGRCLKKGVHAHLMAFLMRVVPRCGGNYVFSWLKKHFRCLAFAVIFFLNL